jgi:hypothetical protein
MSIQDSNIKEDIKQNLDVGKPKDKMKLEFGIDESLPIAATITT